MVSVQPLHNNANVYRVTDKEFGVPIYINPKNRLCGPEKNIAMMLKINRTVLGTYVSDHMSDTCYITSVTNKISMIKLVPIDLCISFTNERLANGKITKDDHGKIIKRLNRYIAAVEEYIQTRQSPTPIESTEDSYQLTELKREISIMKQMIERQEHLIEILLNAHPEIIIEETVEMIEPSTVTDYNIIITKDPDNGDRLLMDQELSTDHTPIEGALLDRKFYISLDQLMDLKRKLLLKSGDLISEMGDNYVIVNDIDEFMDTFKHKLRKINKNNKKTESDNISTVSSID